MIHDIMDAMKLEFQQIGTIYSPFRELGGMPIQPAAGKGIPGRVILDEAYTTGLLDLEGFSHIILLYVFHRCSGYNLQVIPFLDTSLHGLFATRAPRRPNPIGLSVVQLESVERNVLYIRDVDILDGTPLLDIKPYVPDFDPAGTVRTGWLEKARETIPDRKSDDRFTGDEVSRDTSQEHS